MDLSTILFRLLFLLGLFHTVRYAYSILSFLHLHLIHSSKIKRYLLPGAWALVTGASQGIGSATARELANRGFNVILHGRNQAKLEGLIIQLRSEFPSRSFQLVIADAVNSAELISSIQRITEELGELPGPLTVLVNNIGAVQGVYGGQNPFHAIQDQKAKDVDGILDINIRFTVQLTRAVLPLLAGSVGQSKQVANDQKGRPFLVMNVSSLGGLWGTPLLAVYTATKAAVHRMSEALSQEFRLQRLYSNGESICYMVGETAGPSLPLHEVNLMIPTAGTIARDMVDKVGCGWLSVAPYWAHSLARMVVLDTFPQWALILIFKVEIIGILRKWKNYDLDSAKEE